MTSVPTKLATLTLANAIESHSTTLAVVRLNNISVPEPGHSRHQAHQPVHYSTETSGGTSRRGSISKSTCVRV
jgi:hypothetical protein